jgi:hypothetical protein
VAAREPALAGRFGNGLLLDGEGQLANDQWMAALAVEIDRLGGSGLKARRSNPWKPGASCARGRPTRWMWRLMRAVWVQGKWAAATRCAACAAKC